ncbi:hypothetical protein, partial [Cephaloticoccus capnophilus]|uniref:ADP-ribosyltransferase-containing protein n=1 Tax=Cephaloticoccus capnophilus TaxID=1548208 RepID=UPI0018D37310
QAYFVGKSESWYVPIPQSVRAWLEKFRAFLGELFESARHLMRLDAEGKLDAGFKQTLAEAVGLDMATVAALRQEGWAGGDEVRAIAGGRASGIGDLEGVMFSQTREGAEGNPDHVGDSSTFELRAFHGRRYEQAKGAGQTELTAHQWEQVHTPEFKSWFGDWQRLRAEERLDAMEPVELALEEKYKGASVVELRAAVLAHLRDLAKHGAKANHPELGEVGFATSRIRKVISTSAAPEKLHATLDIIRVLESAHLVESVDSYKPKETQEGTLYHTLAAKVKAFDREFVAVVTVRELKDGLKFYNTIAVEAVKKEAASRTYPRASESLDSDSTSALHEAAGRSKLSQLQRVKSESVSKVLNPRTGEPLVVYHSTGEKFSIFDITKSRSWAGQPDYDLPGFYFTDDAGQSGDYGPRRIAAYLSMQRPFTGNVLSYKTEHGLETWRETYEALRKDGFDGVIDWDTAAESGVREFIAFSPEQIKSATGNRGSFDAQNPDTTRQLRPVNRPTAEQQKAALKQQVFEASG